MANEENNAWYLMWDFRHAHLMKKTLTEAEAGRMFFACMEIAENGEAAVPALEWQSNVASEVFEVVKAPATATYKATHKDPVKQKNGGTGGRQRAENERIRQENAASSEPPVWSCKSKKDFEAAVFAMLKDFDAHVPRNIVGDLYKELLRNNWRVGSVPVTCSEDCVSLLDGERDDNAAENYCDCVPNKTQIIRYLFANCNGFREHEGGSCQAEYVVESFIEYLGYKPSTYHGIKIPDWETKLDGFAETRQTDDGYYDSSS